MSAEWLESQHFPAGSEPSDVYVWVQERNQDWVAEFTGLPIEEIEARYKAAFAKGLICIIKLKWADIKKVDL